MKPEALEPFRPGQDGPWGRAQAAHLLRRAGFGGSSADVERVLGLGPEKSVEELFAKARTFSPEDLLEETEAPLLAANDIEDLEASWLLRMVRNRQPLREKMTLFWHGHFATSNAKVKSPALMHRQNRLLFREGLGSFEGLLQQVSKDPAMLVWLDSEGNVKGRPNENYARELMELFSLGIGNYTEKDVQEAARAFTGWGVRDGEFRFSPKFHDAGEKSVLGRKGVWQGEDVVRLCAGKPACAEFLVRKILRFFVLPDPQPAVVQALAEEFRRRRLEVAPLLETVFRSQLFFSEKAYRANIKSPVELAVGALLATGARVNLKALASRLGQMGQRLYHPPTVKGWDGGRAWINSATLLMRSNLAEGIVRGGGPLESQFDPASLFPLNGGEASQAVDALLDGEVDAGVRNKLSAISEPRALLHLVMALPEYQLN